MVIRTSISILLGMLIMPVQVHAVEVSEPQAQRAPAVRIQIMLPQEQQVPDGLFARIQKLLGARNLQRIRPAVGTQFTVVASAYAPSVYQTDSTPCITAVGTRVRRGVVASNFLPIGTLLEIDGETFIVEDRMSSRYDGYYIDIFFPHTDEALEFGKQKQTITIIGYGEPGQPLPGEEPPQEEVVNQEETSGFVNQIRGRLQYVSRTIGQLIGARAPAEVNRYDVDCFGTEE